MAERRMFHRAVVESDAFMDLPPQVQALYFHLGMQGDDDGFVAGPRQIARSLGLGQEQLEMLIDAQFILWFDGIAVIRHWRMANTLQNDRIKPLRYPDIARGIYIRPDRVYTTRREKNALNLLAQRRKLMDSMRNPDGIQSESDGIPNRKEQKGKEEKRKEQNSEEASVEEDDGIPARPPDLDSELKIMNGKLGKGVVLLSEREQEQLLEQLGLDGFDHYVEKLARFIIANHAKVSNHYATILKWWQEDRGVEND